jgi:hypothetical protein
VVAAAAGAAAPAARATGTTDPGTTGIRKKGGLRAALFPNLRRTGIEAVVILALVAGAGAFLYYWGDDTVRNQRPLGGANVDVSGRLGTESQASFAVDPSRRGVVVGATNQRLYASFDDGRRWQHRPSPSVRGGCLFGAPRMAVDRTGRQYLAFLVGSPCGDVYTPHLVVTSRTGPTARWSTPVRVTTPAWKYGFDDAPALAVGSPGQLYLAWTRDLGQNAATVVVSSSRDGGRRWSRPVAVARSADHPHSASIVIGPRGEVVVAGIDAKRGIWVARSVDHGRTFGAVRRAAPLAANPAGDCALASFSPLPTEERTCTGPNPTVLAAGDRIVVVYGDAGANGTPDVLASVLDRRLRVVTHAEVSPPDKGRSQQLFPTAAVDRTTGTLWACWYDTTFDPHAHGAWYTCAASRDGRQWSAPVRAAAVPTATGDLYASLGEDGLSTSVTALDGAAHPFWIDGRNIDVGQDVFTARIPERTVFAAKP